MIIRLILLMCTLSVQIRFIRNDNYLDYLMDLSMMLKIKTRKVDVFLSQKFAQIIYFVLYIKRLPTYLFQYRSEI